MFQSFFAKASQRSGQQVREVVFKYVALLPILADEAKDKKEYAYFLKQLMIALIVSFTSSSRPSGAPS